MISYENGYLINTFFREFSIRLNDPKCRSKEIHRDTPPRIFLESRNELVINLRKDINNSGNQNAMGLKKQSYYYSPKNILNITFLQNRKTYDRRRYSIVIGDGDQRPSDYLVI
jgi:hypothetical protein